MKHFIIALIVLAPSLAFADYYGISNGSCYLRDTDGNFTGSPIDMSYCSWNPSSYGIENGACYGVDQYGTPEGEAVDLSYCAANSNNFGMQNGECYAQGPYGLQGAPVSLSYCGM